MNTHQAIIARHSTRNFSPEAVSAEIMAELKQMCANAGQPISGEEARIAIVEKATDGKIGTYGVIRGAQGFLALCYKPKSPLSAVNAGMMMERIVIWLTQHGVATCWLGGTFSRSEAAKSAGLKADEKMPAVVAYGIAAANDGLLSRIMKWAAKSKQRKPFDELFEVSADSPFRDALEMMRLAPSSLNKQPWRARPSADGIDFFVNEDNESNRLDLGIGLGNFTLAAPQGEFYRREGATFRNYAYVISWRTKKSL